MESGSRSRLYMITKNKRNIYIYWLTKETDRLTSKDTTKLANKNNLLHTYIKNSESLIKDRPGKPTINGYQTYEVLKGSTDQTVRILCKKIISLATDYCDSLELPYNKSNGNNRYEISGWGVALKTDHSLIFALLTSKVQTNTKLVLTCMLLSFGLKKEDS